MELLGLHLVCLSIERSRYVLVWTCWT